MSRFWPHTAYAEDQPYSHAILTTHVLTRAVQAGSAVGNGVGTAVFLLRHFHIISSRIPPKTFTTTLLRSTGIGAIVGTGILAVALPIRMAGREEIEWKDRSWRLLENKGQVECDDWTYGGMAIGTVTAIAQRGTSSWIVSAGKIGIGSLYSVIGYMGWRYGVKGGKWEDTTL